MDRHSILRSTSLAAAALVVGGMLAACSAVTGAPPTDAPGSPTPSAPASPIPTVAPSPSPSGDLVVDLDIATDHEVTVVIDDRGGVITGASSGRAGDGMSVRWGDVEVVNVDDDTLRVTWVGLPVDAKVGLAVTEDGSGYRLVFEQPAPPADSDAIGFDRVIVLDFAGPVSAEDVDASVVEADA